MSSAQGYYNGYKAEKIARDYLIGIGFNILKHRWRSSYGEIDIIATYKELIIFCEVKFRKRRESFSELIISNSQKKRIMLSAICFIEKFFKDYKNFDIRFDCILLTNCGILDHIENAFIES